MYAYLGTQRSAQILRRCAGGPGGLIGGRVMTQLLYTTLVPKRHSASVLPKEA